MKTLILSMVLGIGLMSVGPTAGFGQVLRIEVEELDRFTAVCPFTGAASTVYCAIAVPVASAKQVYLDKATVTTPTATTVTFGWGGTAPTGTALSAGEYIKRNTSAAPVAVVYTNASTTGAAAQSISYPITANVPTPYALASHRFASGVGNTRTLLVSLTGVTGSGQVVFSFGQTK